MSSGVRLWIVREEDHRPELADVLSADERERAAAYRDEETRRRFVVGHAAKRLIAAEQLGVPPELLVWREGAYGKPELSGLHLNLSHSGGYVLIAVSGDRPVGVDIQQIAAGLDPVAMARRYFPDEEAAHVRAGDDAAERFASLWARKEALVKAAGGRLTKALPVPVLGRSVVEYRGVGHQGAYRLRDAAAPDGYRAAVALAGPEDFAVDRLTWQAPRPDALAAASAS